MCAGEGVACTASRGRKERKKRRQPYPELLVFSSACASIIDDHLIQETGADLGHRPPDLIVRFTWPSYCYTYLVDGKH